jgi:pre-mRNA-splicing factor RBM22/SLT11
MLDLSFGLPISVRDAALKMVAPGPQSEVNREFFAQNNEREIEEGRGLEGYEKTDEKARELLRRLAQSEPYYKKQRRLEAEGASEGGQKLLEGAEQQQLSEPGPIRTKDSRERRSAYGNANPRASGGMGGARPPAKRVKAQPIRPEDILPPQDKSITSLFVTGVEDDLPEHAIRTHFAQYGTLRSLVCSHRSHCAFINYMSRESAEQAAATCQGKAIVQGVPLRVQWGKPKPLDSLDRDQRMENAKAGRAVAAGSASGGNGKRKAIEGPETKEEDWDALAASVAAPPGQDEGVEYAALAGE